MSKFTEIVKNEVSKDGGLLVFSAYDIPIKQSQKNPFREDKTASFSVRYVKNKVLYKDFATDEKGDCYTLVQTLENCNFVDACKYIAKIYGVDVPNFSPKNHFKKFVKKSNPKREILETKTEIFGLDFCDWKKEHKAFIIKKLGSEYLDTAKKYLVPTLSFQCRKIQNGKEVSTWKNSRFEIGFFYGNSENETGKIYAPNGDLYGNAKKRKTAFVQKDEFYRNLGFSELDWTRKIYICEGVSDFIALKSKGYNVFDNEATTNKIPAYFEARAELENFDLSNLVYVLDKDKPSLQAVKKHAQNYNCTYVILPKISGSKTENDVSDYVKKFGFDSDLRKALINPVAPPKTGFKPLDIPKYINKEKYDYFGYNRKHLSNISYENLEVENLLSEHQKIILRSIAGSGKTEFVVRLAKKQGKRLLIVLPYKILTSQQRSRNNSDTHIKELQNELQSVLNEISATLSIPQKSDFRFTTITETNLNGSKSERKVLNPNRKKDFENSVFELKNIPVYAERFNQFFARTDSKYLLQLSDNHVEKSKNELRDIAKKIKSEFSILPESDFSTFSEFKNYIFSFRKHESFTKIIDSYFSNYQTFSIDKARKNEFEKLLFDLEKIKIGEVEKIKNEYEIKICEAKELATICIDGNSTREEIEEAQKADFVAVTYDSIHKVVSSFSTSNTIFAVDEFHNFSFSAGYRSDSVNKLLEVSQKFDTQILMSATPDYLFAYQFDYFVAYVQTTTDQEINYKPAIYDQKTGKKAVILDIAEKSILEGKKIAIYHNHKSDLRQIKETLIANNIAENQDFAEIYNLDNDSLELENTPAYQSILKSERLPESAKILLCTAKLTDGSQIKNSEFSELVMIDISNLNPLIQFPARFRNVKKINVTCLFSESKLKNETVNFCVLEKLVSFSRIASFQKKQVKDAIIESDLRQKENLSRIELPEKDFVYISDSQELRTNFLQIFNVIHNQFFSCLSLSDLFQEIKKFAPHTKIQNVDFYDFENTESIEKNKKILSQIAKNEKIKKETSAFLAFDFLAKNEKQAFCFVAIYDKKNRNEILEVIGLSKDSPEFIVQCRNFEAQKNEISEFIKPLSEKIKRLVFLKTHFVEQNFTRFLDMKKSEFTRFKNRFEMYRNLEMFNKELRKKIKTKNGYFRPERFENDILTIQKMSKKNNSLPINDIVKSLNENRKHAKKLTTNEAVNYLSNVTECKTKTKNKIIVSVTPNFVFSDLSEFCKHYKLDLQESILIPVLNEVELTKNSIQEIFEKKGFSIAKMVENLQTHYSENEINDFYDSAEISAELRDLSICPF